MNDPSDRIGLRYPNDDAYSKTKSQPRTWHNQRADPNNRRVRFLDLEWEQEKVHACVRTCGTGEAAARDKACYGGGGGRGVRRRRNQTKRHGTGVWIQLVCVIFALRVFAYLLGSKFYAGRRADRLGERKEAHCE